MNEIGYLKMKPDILGQKYIYGSTGWFGMGNFDPKALKRKVWPASAGFINISRCFNVICKNLWDYRNIYL